MCGIWGYIGKESSLDTLVSVAHRGPDDFGSKSFVTPAGRLDLANWRLKILDLSPLGHQPMSYAGGRFWVVYNGEIYNYRELRKELEGKGHRFRSECDTEVLLASYAQWREGCVARFNGMFAFCLWDDASRKLFVARDRFGVKPFYFYQSPQGIAFASELKQFYGLPNFRPRMNTQQAYEFLVYGFQDHTPETMFRDVHQLKGGEYILMDLGTWRFGQQLTQKCWYTLGSLEDFKGTTDEAVDQYRDLLFDSVRLRLRSDVPVGSCLSGGMDSSSIVGIVNRILQETGSASLQKTYTSCFDIEEFDERKYVNEVVSRAHVDAHYVFPRKEDLFEVLDRIVWHQDAPFNTTSVFAQWEVFRQARSSGTIVMLDGQGGDEQLGSYPQFFGPQVWGLALQLKMLSAFHEARCLKKLHGWKYRGLMTGLLSSYAPFGLYRLMRLSRTDRPYVPPWINENELTSMGIDPSHSWRFVHGLSSPFDTKGLSKIMITTTTLPMLLHWEDRNSMAHSVEARLPFLDYRLVEFALSLPTSLKTREGVTKVVLRKASNDVVPRKVLARYDKMGFATPEAMWMKDSLRDLFRQGIDSACASFPDLIKKSEVQKHFGRVISGEQPYSNMFWRIVSIGAWGRVFKVAS